MKYTREYVEMKGRAMRTSPQVNGDWVEVSALGNRMYARRDDFSVTPCLINDGYWEPWITTWLLNNLTPNTMFVDVGANCGYYSFVASRFAKRVVAIEANPEYAMMLHASRDLSDSKIEIVNSAIANSHGIVDLRIPGQLEGSASITDIDFSDYDVRIVQVNTAPLDYYLESLPVESDMIIKVDTEGAEEMVWDGASNTRAHHRPVWMLEYSPGAYGPLFLDKLEEYGDLCWINHQGIEEPIAQGPVLDAKDWIMLVIRPRK